MKQDYHRKLDAHDVSESIFSEPVERKTNKFIYFKNGTYMNKNDFNKLLKVKRTEKERINAQLNEKTKDFKPLVLVDKKLFEEESKIYIELKAESKMETLLDRIKLLERAAESIPDAEVYMNMFDQAEDTYRRFKNQTYEAVRNLYKDFTSLPILKTLENTEPAKFIIQVNEKEKTYRFRFDPYKFLPNAHFDLSQVFTGDNYYTANGGWFRIIDGVIYLYAQSGDYGVYDNEIALQAAKEVFGDKTIVSFAGKQWSDDFLTS